MLKIKSHFIYKDTLLLTGELTVIMDPAKQDQVNSKDVLAKCEMDGEGYYEGQRVYPNKSPCSKCLCQRNPNNGKIIIHFSRDIM